MLTTPFLISTHIFFKILPNTKNSNICKVLFGVKCKIFHVVLVQFTHKYCYVLLFLYTFNRGEINCPGYNEKIIIK
jgi:hypothetical protein